MTVGSVMRSPSVPLASLAFVAVNLDGDVSMRAFSCPSLPVAACSPGSILRRDGVGVVVGGPRDNLTTVDGEAVVVRRVRAV